MKEKKRKEKKMTGLTVRKEGRGWERIVKSRNLREIELTMVVVVSW